MNLTSRNEDRTATIGLDGRFTFEAHAAFKASTRNALETPGLERIVLDMEKVTYLDASSLGMILLLREAAEARQVSVELRRPSAPVMNLLEVVRFERLFKITS
ncbi:STAS domain-containing protein [Mesoterricola sediminis]|uniref:STAS domain-containing protein n=1 Tax=Mesoterricola sediminis TaxID=2927980 RepID=A0AA48GVM8_9BACT|nr:STAS domain-containing protein [Mesoterricola sediminis]BDU76480.1 STAS domain-containing protein [Mesoterricola sediminis]